MRHKIPDCQKAGLTLVEAMLGLTVVLIVGGLAFPQINRYLKVYSLDSAAQTLSSSLEVARYSAISRKRNMVIQFYVPTSRYEVFEDRNGNGIHEVDEPLTGKYTLPRQVQFSGTALFGPPSNPSSPVTDPVTFGSDRIVLNPEGKVNGGIGTIYVQNSSGDAFAFSYNLAGRLKVYQWNRFAQTWK